MNMPDNDNSTRETIGHCLHFFSSAPINNPGYFLELKRALLFFFLHFTSFKIRLCEFIHAKERIIPISLVNVG